MSNYVPPNYDAAADGCSGCGSQDTVTLDGEYGRRCAEHAPWKSLAAEGRFPEAWRCLGLWMAREDGAA